MGGEWRANSKINLQGKIGEKTSTLNCNGTQNFRYNRVDLKTLGYFNLLEIGWFKKEFLLIKLM